MLGLTICLFAGAGFKEPSLRYVVEGDIYATMMLCRF